MLSGRSQFVGVAGQHFVAYALSVRGIHAAITLGNVPAVDIAIARHDGAIGLSIQVKTSRWAYRPNRYKKELCEWDVGASAVGRWSDSLWYTFVDLQEEERANGELTWNPRVFVVPSLWVGSFVKEEWSRKRYMLPKDAWPQCLERWDRVSAFFSGDPDTASWCKTVPPEAVDWS
jgi:hypothetical protein